MKAFVRAFLLLCVLAALAGSVLLYSVTRRGLSTRTQPSRIEQAAARTARRLATPSAMRSRANPVQPTREVLDEGLAHFADHCAMCHANDGSGDTTMGRNLYPRAPDMRASATQSLSDGELFSIIENGIRLSGMPGWGDGTPESERASWVLVHFIRRLPSLTPEDIKRMEALNPKSPDEIREGDPGAPAGEHTHGAKPAGRPKGHKH